MQAIETKFLPATNNRGSRLKAYCERGSIAISYPHELSGDKAHAAAVDALIAKFCAEDLKQYGTPIDKNPWNAPYRIGGTKAGCVAVYSSYDEYTPNLNGGAQ